MRSIYVDRLKGWSDVCMKGRGACRSQVKSPMLYSQKTNEALFALVVPV
jgi:predicted alpha/beta-fold hydrolase